ncbi:hypothetical protein J1614_004434 [Plenodomus biglobosus]|nr:hypothetical protein J1614_004434 [Plenodomus biglobosus]
MSCDVATGVQSPMSMCFVCFGTYMYSSHVNDVGLSHATSLQYQHALFKISSPALDLVTRGAPTPPGSAAAPTELARSQVSGGAHQSSKDNLIQPKQ